VSSLVETGLWVFKRAEHEWLRIAAVVAPDRAKLRTLGRLAGFDWWYLWNTSGLHQLDGVISWRCLDGRVADVVPEDVRERCRGHLEATETRNRRWWASVVAPAVSALEAAGVRWVTSSGLAQYLPLRMSEGIFPRGWDDFDVFMPAQCHRDACRALEATGFALDYVMNQDLNPVYKAENGMRVEIIGLPPEHPDLAYWWWHHRPEFYAGRVLREVEGLPVWTPAPEWMVALMAYRTYVSFCRNAAPLPLWGLARLWAWRQWAGEAWDEAEFVRAIRLAAEVGFEATAHLPSVTWGRGILFILDVASRVYGPLVPDELRDMLSGPFYFLRSTRNRREQAGEGEGAHVLCTIDQWPSDEAVIFDVGYNRGLEAKVASKLWRRVTSAE
jgi:hypothetical protein